MPSAFTDKSQLPDDSALAGMLGPAKVGWDAILDGAAELAREWKFYGVKHGWQLRLLDGKRVALYLIPQDNGFVAALALREAALDALRAAKIPPALLRDIEAAKPGPEGRPARVQVTGAKDADLVRKLLAVKLSGSIGSRAAAPSLTARSRTRRW